MRRHEVPHHACRARRAHAAGRDRHSRDHSRRAWLVRPPFRAGSRRSGRHHIPGKCDGRSGLADPHGGARKPWLATCGLTSTGGSSPAAGPGPLLSAQPYASYSFRVWPGTTSAAARAALTGLTVRVRRQGPGITVAAGVSGQRAAAPRFYPHGARVYIVEASLGDDSGNSDYSLGDDGLIVTDAHGRILR